MSGRWAKVMTFATVCVCVGELSVSAQDKQDRVEQGAGLFTAQKCVMCHAVAGKGNAKGALDGVGKKLSEADIRAWLADPQAMQTKTGATRTPAMKKQQLSPAQVDALVAYLSSLKK